MINRIYKNAAKSLAASKYSTGVLGGTKMSNTKLKKNIISRIESGGISARKLEKDLKDEGMNIKKRRSLIKKLTGNDVVKLSKKEIQKHALRVKMRIKAAFQTERMGRGHGGMVSSKEDIRKKALGDAMRGSAGANSSPKEGSVTSGLGTGSSVATIGGASAGPAPTTGSTGSSGPPIGFNKNL